jgi:hypothetical protein
MGTKNTYIYPAQKNTKKKKKKKQKLKEYLKERRTQTSYEEISLKETEDT